MYCVGWKEKSNCRPVLEVAVDTCPPIGWFLALAAGVAVWTLSGSRKGSR